jgi:hypothetical protein
LRFSDLSSARQALVRLCQDVNFGQILDLRVANAEPIRNPGPTVLAEVSLDMDDAPRPEGALADFRISSELQRVMSQLDQIKDGRVEKIEVRAGVLRRITLASRPA